MGERGELNGLIEADSKEVVVCVCLIKIFHVKCDINVRDAA